MSSMYREGEREMQADEDDTKACVPGEAVEMCDHICLRPASHIAEGLPHFHGYELPSPRGPGRLRSRPVGEEPEPSAINAAIAELRAAADRRPGGRGRPGSLSDAAYHLLDLLPPEGWPEPLPEMMGDEIAEALRNGETVHVKRNGDWSLTGITLRDALWQRLGQVTVVARVAVPPEPQTELVPWWEAVKDRRRLADDGDALIGGTVVGCLRATSGWTLATSVDGAARFVNDSSDGCVRVLVSDEGDE